ncbi:flavin reductase family protein [Conexibacter arvalis]|uniref:Flavin reductase (DIM6/NTAB) family NADH-FMN oxidoreductase RutF n=1 Tax=Conexibacter arvalis TaxID=912552 RepID=A0A840IEF9_9ACTN|nr:flavin reductase family protein [Conexibacter arvalis]MBB4662320.1 flavin reductase (DIM6/NTAB) family NADH-FMN oxidoreductase RutF [Conexibacter arvalis]
MTTPMPGIETTFARLTAELDAPMLIVTTEGGGERAGCLVGFWTQSSIRPPRFLVCISRLNHTYKVAVRAERMIVHFVPEGATELAELFGGETGDDVDKFAAVDWHRGPGGVPLLDGLDTWFAGDVVERVGLGDHVGFLLAPIDGAVRRTAAPRLRFHRARRIEPGHPA